MTSHATAQWSLHPDAALRMAGFPFHRWEEQLPADLVAGLSTLDDAWAAVSAHRNRLLTATFPAVVERTADRAALRLLSTTRAKVGRFRRVDAEPDDVGLRHDLSRWTALLDAADRATAEFRERYPTHLRRLREQLHRSVGRDPVREAVGLLNPGFGQVLTGYLAQGPASAPRSRDHSLEQRIVLYLQRLTAKNETNSFFGPIGTATIDPQGPDGFTVSGVPDCGPPTVFSSPHVSRALASRIASDPELAAEIPLRRSPMFEVVGDRLVHLPTGRSTHLTADELAAWNAGRRHVDGEGDAAARLIRFGALLPRIPLDLYSAEPLDSLVDWLRRLRHRSTATHWLDRISDLRAGITAFATTTGAGRGGALSMLERRVAELTERPERRGAGEMYADRSVLFEERENQLTLTIGGERAATLPAELEPALTYWAAVGRQRWAQHQRAAIALFDRTWPNATEIPLPAYLAAAAQLPVVDEPTGAQTHIAELVGESTDEVRLAPEQLSALASALDGPVLSSVDIMIAGDSPGAGGSRWVFGEAHAGHLLSVFPTDYYARARRPLASEERDRWLFDALSRAGRRPAWLVTGRETKIFQYPQPAVAVQLRPHLPDDKALPASRLRVRREVDQVVLHDDRGPLWLLPAVRPATTGFDPLAPLSVPAVQNIPFGGDGSRPRVVIGNVVAQRASWHIPIPRLTALSGVDQFLAARSFRREHNMPELVFVRLPWERKPTLLDFRNPLSVRAFAGQLRNAPAGQPERLRFTEMLPGPDDLWLAGGRTFELRVLAVRAPAS